LSQPAQLVGAAERLIKWADENGQPDKVITFPDFMRKHLILEDGKWRGHPVKFLRTPKKQSAD
jgi:hypothetical protein